MVTSDHSALDLLKCTLAPAEYCTMPPSFNTQTTFAKRIDCSGNFTVAATPTGALSDNVPTTSGLIIWMPGRGLESCYRFGIVPGGQVSTGAAMSGEPYFQAFHPLIHELTGNQFELTYNSPLPLPYNANVVGEATPDVIVFAPNASNGMFSQSRIFAGSLRVVSDTAPIGATTLSGYLTVAAVSDITDVFGGLGLQAIGTTSAVAADPATLTQNAVLAKDVLKEVSVCRGVVALVGCDISPYLTAPSVDSLYRRGGTMCTPVQMNPAWFNTPVILTSSALTISYVAWVTPYAIQDTTTYPTAGAHPYIQPTSQQVFINVNSGGTSGGVLNPIGGALEIDVSLSMTATANQDAGYQEETVVTFWHLYATVTSADGAIFYDQAEESFLVQTSNQDDDPNFQVVVTACPKKYMTAGFADWNEANPRNGESTYNVSCGGMYIGTSIVIITQSVSSVNGTGTCSKIVSGNILARCVDDYLPGELGPCRIVRYDSLSPGMLLRVDGTFYAECIPGAFTAPYVQAAGNMNRSCVNLNALSFLSFAYNSDDTPFRRVWDAYEWRDFVKGVVPQLSVEFLQSFNNPRLLAAAKAAGIDGTEENPSKKSKSSGRAVSVYPSSLAPQEFSAPSNTVASRLKDLDRIMENVQAETERANVYRPPPNY